MANVVSQLLENYELIAVAIGLSGVYWKLDKRMTRLESWCDPFFSKMFEESIDRVIGNNS